MNIQSIKRNSALARLLIEKGYGEIKVKELPVAITPDNRLDVMKELSEVDVRSDLEDVVAFNKDNDTVFVINIPSRNLSNLIVAELDIDDFSVTKYGSVGLPLYLYDGGPVSSVVRHLVSNSNFTVLD